MGVGFPGLSKIPLVESQMMWESEPNATEPRIMCKKRKERVNDC